MIKEVKATKKNEVQPHFLVTDKDEKVVARFFWGDGEYDLNKAEAKASAEKLDKEQNA